MSDRLPILVASSSFDEHTHGPVVELLRRNGFTVVVYNADRVLEGTERFSLDITAAGAVRMLYEGVDIGPGCVSAAWYWKVNNFRIPGAEANLSKQLTIVNELAQYNHSLWSLYPERAWLSAPENIFRAERKLHQLVIAQELGFTIPPTHIGNSWDDIDQASAGDDQGIIVKMFRGVIGDHNKVKAMYTTRLTPEVLADLRERAVPFPGMYQPFLKKVREWRVTVVGDDVFAGAIYTTEDAKDDWRRMQATAAVALRKERLDDTTSDLCRSYLKAMGLGIGSFDLVEGPGGDMTFLECNPSGQFGFLEEILGLPISESVAAHLASIASSPTG
jgi:glutathione synthase/RimK-type ligase-like ATP-grasp enzyme